MSCSWKIPVVHELGLCNCFKPRDFAELLETERLWFELLMRLTRYRFEHPDCGEGRAIALILHERTRYLRN